MPLIVDQRAAHDLGQRQLLLAGLGREDGETPALNRADRPEGALVERHDPAGVVPGCEEHERSVRKADLELRVLLDEQSAACDVVLVEALADEGPLREILKECELDLETQPVQDQVVRFRDRELTRNQGLAFGS